MNVYNGNFLVFNLSWKILLLFNGKKGFFFYDRLFVFFYVLMILIFIVR